ncbi:uncharacterized protein CLUP02_13156 [Colletotrichum lupini]|uniref:Uncharacterized protein n=1 Tax=Colletotrichum lupini TaxID=145971 RepID=A0A9Q8WL56_9PEZI|nr:uncharacterized protein CLUP02_13156 [Colletotrichum lupini]UQC87638.1 hypothetical protein CLUP02_13156 [Colletotrichum lupini]
MMGPPPIAWGVEATRPSFSHIPMNDSQRNVGARGTQKTCGNCRKIGRARHSRPSQAYIIAHDAAAICIKNLAENTSTLAYRKLSTDGGKSRGDIQATWSMKRGDWGKNGAL